MWCLSAQALGVFDCAAANEPGFHVRAAVYAVDVDGAINPKAEIDRLVWVDPRALPDLPFAPLTLDHVLPLARMQSLAFQHLGLPEPARDSAQVGLFGQDGEK